MIDNDLELLADLRSEVPAPDEETADRIYRLATTRKQHLLTEIAKNQRQFPWLAITPASLAGRRRVLVAAAALIVVAVAIGVVVTRGGTGTASAGEVRAKLTEGLHFGQSIRGEFSVRTQTPGPLPRRYRGCRNQNCTTPVIPQPSKFVIGTDGSYSSLTLPLDATKRQDIAYNATTGIETSFGQFSDPRSGRPLYIRATNLDPASQTSTPEARLGAWVQGALADRNPRIRNTSFNGREAWELTVTFIVGETLYDTYGGRVDVVVDQATGLVLQVTQYAYSTTRWSSIESVHDLKIGGPTSAADFTVPKPAGTREIAHDLKFRRVPITAAATIVGYRPLLPTDTRGRARSDFAVAKTTDLAPPGLGGHFRLHGVVSARYGNGPDSITVSTRRGRLNELLTNTGLGSARPLKLTRGPLVGDYAYVSTDPLRRTLFAAFHHGLLVQITAPSAHDAITAAETLQPAA
jgi:hypothetical protein